MPKQMQKTMYNRMKGFLPGEIDTIASVDNLIVAVFVLFKHLSNAAYFAVKIIKLSRTAKLIHKKPYICILKKKITSKMEKQPLNRFR